MEAPQSIYACQDDILMFKPSIRMEKEGNLCDFKHGTVVSDAQAGLSISVNTATHWKKPMSMPEKARGELPDCFRLILRQQ